MTSSLLSDPKDMNDIAPDHPARHIACINQSYFKTRALLFDGQLFHPIRALQQASTPAFTPRVSNQSGAVITNSLHCKGE